MTTIAATSSGTASSSATPTTSSSSFNEENLMRKLDNCTPTQESIQTLALWIIHHKNHNEIITKLWLKKMSDSNVNNKHKLTMFYLANDVIQNCKRKNAKVYQESFKNVLGQAIVHCRSESILKNVERVLEVWIERQIYDKDFVTKLIASLNYKSNLLTHSPVQDEPKKKDLEKNEIGKDDIERIITEFQPKQLCDSINDFESFLNQINTIRSEIESSRLTEISFDHIKQYRDRTQCEKFKTEFESSSQKLEQYVQKLGEQLERRKQLVKLMEQSEIFYDAQYKDAKTVFNAYRNYGSKVHGVKKKLDELMDTKFSMNKNLENLDMEMSDDDQIPSQSSLNSLVHNSTSSSKSQVRTNLDPRQNRQHKQVDQAKKRDRSNTPVRDENPENSSSSNNSPLDFLTKFINKSSNQNEAAPTTTQSGSQNLSFLVNSLQKFVNNGASGYNQSNEFYNPGGMSYQPSFIAQEGNRPGTPTKDEVYQQQIILPQQPPSYNPLMVPGPPPPPYQMYQPSMSMIPPPPMPGQLMIDPYQHMSYHPAPPPGYYPPQNKVLISPVPSSVSPQQISPLMSVPSQPPPVISPKPNTGQNWNNDRNDSKTETNFQPTQKRPLLSNPIISPTNKHRKFSFEETGQNRQGSVNRFKPFQHNGHNNRIPTINSQRDRGEQQSGGTNSSNNFNNNRNRFY